MTESDGSKQPNSPAPAIVWQRRLRTTAAHALGALGRTLISVGALLLLFVVYQLWGTGLHEARAQHSLSDQFEQLLRTTTTLAPTTTSPTTSATIVETTEPAPTTTLEVQPPEVVAAFGSGDAIARIRAPKIDLDKIVVEGVEVDDLRKGPGHYRSTPMPGQRGNAAVAGHRTTYGAPFNRIDELAPGDEITVSTPQGDFAYKVLPQTDANGEVSGHLIVSPNDVWVLDDMGDNRLTLTACHPKYSANQRIIVQAVLVVPPALTPKLVSKPSGDVTRSTVDTVASTTLPDEPVIAREDLDAGLGGDGSHRWPAIFWGLMVGVFMIAIGHSTRRWGRIRSWAVSALPLVLVVFVFFEHLDRMLPAR
ncbi:MAG: class E sortase [Acidimicrobiales bacterium]